MLLCILHLFLFVSSTVKGMIPKVGDKVLVEASYNASMPFKWNATRVISLVWNVFIMKLVINLKNLLTSKLVCEILYTAAN